MQKLAILAETRGDLLSVCFLTLVCTAAVLNHKVIHSFSVNLFLQKGEWYQSREIPEWRFQLESALIYAEVKFMVTSKFNLVIHKSRSALAVTVQV